MTVFKEAWLSIAVSTIVVVGGLMTGWAGVKNDIARNDERICRLNELPSKVDRLEEGQARIEGKMDFLISIAKRE